MTKYKNTGKVTLFDAKNIKETLSDMGNPLERLAQVMDFEIFRESLKILF
jgi:hypothetical protein